MSGLVIRLAEADASSGAKARSLRWLLDHGHPVPDGIVILPRARMPEIREAIEDFVRPGVRYAVRSSANVEDGAQWSFAGQFTSVLDAVGAANVIKAITDVRASADHPIEYLHEAGVAPTTVEMAVIVQEQIDASRSGVAFSRNPLTGLDEIVVEEVDGLGDRLMAGTVTPHRWVRRWGDWTARPEDRSDAVPRAASEVTASIAEARGHPVDVEWAHDGSTLYLLQVRPQTGSAVGVYSNRIAREVLPGLIKPLVWSVNVPIVNSAWIDLFTSLIGPNDLTPDDLAKSFAYRAYFNMQAIGDIFEALGMRRDLLEVLMGLEGGDERPSFRPGPAVIRHLPRMLGTGLRMLRYRGELDRELTALEARFAAIENADVSTMSDRQLIETLHQLGELSRRAAFANIVAPLLMSFHHRRFRSKVQRAGLDPEAIDPAAGDPRLERFDPNPHLDTLADSFRSLSDDGRKLVLAAPLELPGLAEFLDRFGHLSDSGNDLSHVPWRETPDRVIGIIASRPAAAGRPVAPSGTERAARVAADYRVAREHVSYVYTKGYGLHRGVALEAARRLVDRQMLDEYDDVFYLSFDELTGALDGRAGDLMEIVSLRRSEMAEVTDITMPDIIYGEEFTPAPAADPDHTLRGLATSRGVALGTARVVRSVDEHDRVSEGDILVIPYSDIAWTALFAHAGGVVAEAGGMLSHSSIVARELRIPCVVSVDHAMRIPDGAVVHVDGYTGEVRWSPT